MEKEKEELRRMVDEAVGDPVKQQQLQFARCLFDFEARNEEELHLLAGDILVVTDRRDNNGWWQGQFHGRCGFFPINYVQLLDDVPDNVDEIIRGPGHAPSVPDPAVPTRLSMDVQARRRTALLERLQVDEALRGALPSSPLASQPPAASSPDDSQSDAAVPHEQVQEQEQVQEEVHVQEHVQEAQVEVAVAAISDATEPTPAVEPIDAATEQTASEKSDEVTSPHVSTDADGLMYVGGTALYTFKGETDYELSFNCGDVVDVYTIDHRTGWWQGRSNGNIGYFPGTYVSVPDHAEDVLPVEKVQEAEEAAPEKTEEKTEQRQVGVKVMPIVPSKKDIEDVLEKRKTRLAQPAANPKPSAKSSTKATEPTVTASEPSQQLACILCVCEDWSPLEWEKNLCNNCRHLKKMHRVIATS